MSNIFSPKKRRWNQVEKFIKLYGDAPELKDIKDVIDFLETDKFDHIMEKKIIKWKINKQQ